MAAIINDDGVECEKVDVIQMKTVRKFMSVMSVKFALGFVRFIRHSIVMLYSRPRFIST